MLRPFSKAATAGRGLRALGLAIIWSAIAGTADTAVAQTRPQWQLWRINADGSDLAQFAETPGYSCGSPVWSPDGSLVAYDTWRVEQSWSDSQVAIVPTDGSEPPRLLGPGAMPTWSPDGTQLACHTYGNPQTIDVMNADGSGRETILNRWGSPRWSPRGNRIFSVSRDGSIAMFDCGTGMDRSIVRGPFSIRPGFGVSPDGVRFCFGDQRGGVGVATLDERTMQASVRWLVRNGTCYHASWAPDGKQIVFAWQPADARLHQLYTLEVDSSDPPVWLEGQDPKRNNTNPNWSPDGKVIVFSSQQPDSPTQRTGHNRDRFAE